MKVKKALFAVGVGVLVGGILLSGRVNGMTYQDDVNVQFTFDPTIAMNLSTNRLTIDNLSPGNYNYSNTISINITTNSVYGYTLFAKVGGTGQTAASSDLVSAASNAAFTSLNSSDKVKLANFGDNVWGYTTATTLNNDSLYSGLVYNDNSIINMTKNPSGDAFSATYPGTNVTKFTIGAKASSSQVSGFYSNVITFTAVSNVVTDFIDRIEYMQDFASLDIDERELLFDSMVEGQQYQLKDSRDGKTYYVSKLADGNVWMTQNLDHDIINRTYTSDDTNIYHDWTPAEGEYTVIDELSWANNDKKPQSYDPGDKCWNGYNGFVDCDQVGNHFHLGNYYNWTAAIATSNSDNYNNHIDYYSGDYIAGANHSICPAGWKLPTVGNVSVSDYNISYRNLASNYGFYDYDEYDEYDGMISESYSSMENDPLYFVTGGGFFSGSMEESYRAAFYWTSEFHDDGYSYGLYVRDYSNIIEVSSLIGRSHGHFVRCVAIR